jgi:aldehyde dehydrogenase (NAD(P)+)
MSALAPILELIAPDGKKLTLSTGLFINNEFVRSDSGSKITAIDPA